jgi:hypothetical protein
MTTLTKQKACITCTNCGEPIVKMDLRDAFSREEYIKSGLCQKCQDIYYDHPGSEFWRTL